MLVGTIYLLSGLSKPLHGQSNSQKAIINAPDSLPINDSTGTHRLAPVTITAFQGIGDGTDIAQSIFPVNKQALQLLDNSSLLSAFNAAPGVRLEQRSAGSLRLSIRGSLLRSPYGVRGVKFYMDGMPLTDAGGNTYLQSIGSTQLQSAEIIKGPAASLYGAGTGGAVLLHTPGEFTDTTINRFELGYDGGSFGRMHPSASWLHTAATNYTYISAAHFYSQGNRQQDTTHQTILHYNATYKLSEAFQLRLLGFYSDLDYQTPGGITGSQWGTDTTAYPLAIRQKAGVTNRSLLLGAALKSSISPVIDNETALVFSHTGFKNPFTSNYEKRNEVNYGGRSVFTFHGRGKPSNLQVLAGLEWMGAHDHIDNYGNRQGVADTVQYKDYLVLEKHSLFMQLSMAPGQQNKWHLQAGISGNQQRLSYRRLSDSSFGQTEVARTAYQWAPKIGLTYRLLPAASVFANAAKGFSTPTLAEIHPSDGRFDRSLEPENGWNLEAGLKGRYLNTRLQFQGSIYRFGLNNAIVRRVDKNNTEYYVNAGKTRQSGAEIWLRYELLPSEPPGRPTDSYFQQATLSASYSYQPYRFLDYQAGDQNYNGHPLTGVPKNIAVFSLRLVNKNGLYLHSMVNSTSRIALNDASTVYAAAYTLWQAKLGYRFAIHRLAFNLYVGLDNILDQAYSLGNDINAYGGRYFNPAPGRNYYAGMQLHF